MRKEAITVGDLIGLRRQPGGETDAEVWEEAMRRRKERAQEVREQEAEAASSEAQEGPQAPAGAPGTGARAGGGALGALAGSEGPSQGILATQGEPQATAAPVAKHYSWTGTDRECPDCGGLLPLWHEPSCDGGEARRAREVSE
jgi:hypothetical protein